MAQILETFALRSCVFLILRKWSMTNGNLAMVSERLEPVDRLRRQTDSVKNKVAAILANRVYSGETRYEISHVAQPQPLQKFSNSAEP